MVMGTTAADKRVMTTPASDAHERLTHAQTSTPSTARSALPPRSRLTLERVLGVTSLSNAAVAVNPATGEIAYAAGCIVVIYNLRRNKQVRYYRVEKTVSCLCFSPNGQYLAIGEKGYLPAITIWDGTDGTLCAELQRHKYGVACMAFSRDGRYLLSAGLVHDQHLYAWDLVRDASSNQMNAKVMGVAVVEDKVLSMDYCHEGNFFVSVGERHFKFWFLDVDNQFLVTGFEVDGVPELQGRSAVMAAKEDATFTSVGCGAGACKLKTYAVTSDGTLCSFGVSCVMERLVSLEAACGNALSVTASYVAIGGSSAIVRLFDPSTLEYITTMPFPPALGKANQTPEPQETRELQPEHPYRHPATLAVRLTGSHVMALYSDRSFFIYDIADPQNARVDRSFLFHSGGIREMLVAGRVQGVNPKGKIVYRSQDSLHSRKSASEGSIPLGAFVTCSDDNTVRFWHLDLHKPSTKATRFGQDPASNTDDSLEAEPWKNPFSQEMLDILYHDAADEFDDDEAIVLGGTCAWNDVADVHGAEVDTGSENTLRALSLHPQLNQIVTGDRDGTLRVTSFPVNDELCEISAHSAEVNCIVVGQLPTAQGIKSLIASGGRDHVIYVHDDTKGKLTTNTKLENHSGAITAMQLTSDSRKLVSCGSDKMVAFYDVRADGNVEHYHSVQFPGGKILDMTLSNSDEVVVTTCNNRLDVLNVSTGRIIKTHQVGEQHHIDICPASFCVAMSGSHSDKTIHVVDLESGDILADGTGHGGAITSLKFTPDCRRLVTASNDGCLFVWRLAEDLQNAIKSRLPRVTEGYVAPPVPPPKIEAPIQSIPAPLVMPPPAPPIPQAKAAQKKVSSSPTTPVTRRKPSDAIAQPKASPDMVETVKKQADTPGWKSKAKAAPGPMAKIPMEDWMRTRESAKKTVHVEDRDDDNSSEQEVAVMQIDRSQTPEWARTVKNPVRKTGQKSPVKAIAPNPPRAAGGKWAKRSDENIKFVNEDDGQQAEADISQGESESQDTVSERGLMDLSIANVDVSQSGLLSGSSLSLEREQLEKKKKQMETAKAVAEMNNRLSQLGLLRPQKDRVQGQAEAREPDIVAPTVVDEPSPSSQDDPVRRRLSGIPPEMLESVEFPIIQPTVKPMVTDTHLQHETVVSMSVEIAVDQSVSTFTHGFKVEETTETESVQRGGIVDQSLSSFTGGYSSTNVDNGPRRSPVRTSIGSVSISQTLVDRSAVGASLSTFTEGFSIAGEVHRDVDPRQSLDLSNVAVSMSAFTAGCTDNGANPPYNLAQSRDFSSVSASLSQFTDGYDAPVASTKPDPVDQSLSAFTSGFTTVVSPSRRTSRARSAVDESLSSFTNGYQAEVPPSYDSIDVTESLSNFTTGYTVSLNETQPTGSKSPRQSAIDTISDLNRQLLTSSSVLDALTTPANPELLSDPDVESIRQHLTRLHAAIERFMRHHRVT
ncbi:hypothetical protein Poli38472_005833 [Pythium oligandrum]|uniref:Mitogen-activated protein kinase-binding protein 1 n=1 Tax=Pythium oligandrum TaxID=41045 RepID=A0A8K1CRS9_PYTOL|nr:hypothetical protein Poli38472_005833 [Pythium oligandrum]|eukprot:TMW68365.1 hypothetical protein Poli38472_005833 [Pythium oligandrum]